MFRPPPLSLASVVALLVAIGAAACSSDDATAPAADAVSTADGAATADTAGSTADAAGTFPDGEGFSDDAVAPDVRPPPPLPSLDRATIVDPGGAPTAMRIQPAVAVDHEGRVGVAWTEANGDGDLGIHYAIHGADGALLVAPVQLDTKRVGVRSEPSLCALAGGGAVVAWSMDNQTTEADTPNLEIRFRRIASDGSPLGPEDGPVVTDRAGNHWLAAVACDDRGGFAVAGVRPGEGPGFGAFVQRYDAAGAAVGGAVDLRPDAGASQGFPAIAPLSGGRLAAAWEDTIGVGTEAEASRVLLRTVPVAGEEAGPIREVAGVAGAPAAKPQLAGDGASDTVLVVATMAPSGAPARVVARRFSGAEPAGVGLDLPETSPHVTTLPAVAGLGRAGRYALLFFRRQGDAPGVVLYLVDPVGIGPLTATLYDGDPPPYEPSLHARGGTLAAAWTERDEAHRFRTRLAILVPDPD